MVMRIFELLVLLLVVALSTTSALAPLERALNEPVTTNSIDKLVEVTGANDRGAATPAAETSKPTDPLPAAKPPIAHTYHNAYGTSFKCSSTWTLLLGMHVVVVVGGLLLLSVIPVRFASTETMEAPFVLWFGSTMKKPKEKHLEEEEPEQPRQEEADEVESWWRRASSWLGQTVSRFFVASPSYNVDMRYRFHADMTQQLAASGATAKTYESIAVTTDDLEVAAPPSPKAYEHVAVSTEDLEVKAAPPPQTDESAVDGEALRPLPVQRSPSRSSIFITAPPSPPSVARKRQGSTTLASDSSGVYAESVGRRTSRRSSGGSNVDAKEDFVRAASRRQSMAARAERRVAQVTEDTSYENLGDEDIRIYEYLAFVRELLDGLSIKKICQKSGRVVFRTFSITPDMTTVFWNPIATFKRMTAKSSLLLVSIEGVLKGLHGSASVTARSSPERDALCVSIQCSDGKWLVLEAKTEAMKQRLYLGFSRLAQERQGQDATATAEQVEATILEAREEEEEVEEQKQQVQVHAPSTMKALFARNLDVSGDQLASPLTEDQEGEFMAEQLEYEEKAPLPMLEEMLPEPHMLSSITSYEEGSSVVQQDVAIPPQPESLLSYEEIAHDAQEEGSPLDQLRQEDEADDGLYPEHQEGKHERAFQDQDEAKQVVPPNIASSNDEDIDNLSDDPENSREQRT